MADGFVLDRAVVELVADTAPLRRDLRVASRDFNAATSQMVRNATRIAAVAGTAVGAFGVATVETARRLVVLGSEVEETANKFTTVMGPSAAEVRDRFKELSDVVPLTLSEMERLSAGIQDMLVPMGLARDEAAGLSAGAVEMAADIASFNNVATTDALDAFRSALAGESEPMRRFGVDTRVTRLELLALEEGLIAQGQALDNTTRAQAVFLAVQRDSADAMGDSARTADSVANASRRIGRDVKQAAESLGVMASESFKLSGALGDVEDATQRLNDLISDNEDLIRTGLVAAFDAASISASLFAGGIDLILQSLSKLPGVNIEGLEDIGNHLRAFRLAQQELTHLQQEGTEAEFRRLGALKQQGLSTMEALVTLAQERAAVDQASAKAQEYARDRARERATAERALTSDIRDQQKALQDEIDLLSEAADLDVARVREFNRLLDIQKHLQGVLDDETASIGAQVEAAKDLKRVVEAIAEFIKNNPAVAAILLGTTPKGGPQFEGVEDIADLSDLSASIQRTVDLATRSIGAFKDAVDDVGRLDAVVTGLVSLGDALGFVEGNARDALRGVSDIASGIATFRGALDKAGGIGDALGSVAGAAGAASIVGGVVGLIASAFDNSQERARVEAARKEWEAVLDRYADELADQSRFGKLERQALGQAKADLGTFIQDLFKDIPHDKVRDELQAKVEQAFRELDIDEFTAFVEGAFGDDAQATIDRLNRELERLNTLRQEEIASIQRSLDAEQAYLEGNTALAREIENQEEIIRAVAAGYTDAQIAQLENIQVLREEKRVRDEAAKAAEEAARGVRDFNTALNQAIADAALRSGDIEAWAEAMRILGQADIAQNIAVFQDLADQGLLSQADVDRLAQLWNDQLNDIIEQGILDAERQRRDVLNDLNARELALGGDERGSVVAEVEAEAQRQIDAYEDMLKAGVITRQEFERWVAVISGEALEAIKDFDQAQRESAEASRQAARAAREAAAAEMFRQASDKESLRIQILLAQGREAEAAAAQLQLDIARAIRDGRDAEYIAMLKQLSALKEQERLTREQNRAQEDLNRTISQTTTALNAPAGLRLSLLRWRALVADQVSGPSVNEVSGFTRFRLPETAVANQQTGTSALSGGFNIEGDVNITTSKDESGEDVLRKIETAASNRVRRGAADPLRRRR